MFRSAIGTNHMVSCDVFDTILHRDMRAEGSRFESVARLAATRLRSELGVERSVKAVLRARMAAHRSAYRALDQVDPTGEVRFDTIVTAMVLLLGLDLAAAAVLEGAEIAVETAQLRPNKSLLKWLKAQADLGRRIIAVSDTWHTRETILALLEQVAPGHPIAEVYTSADQNATKRTGTLFKYVVRAEGKQPHQILHIGDDPIADLAMARAAGLRCKSIPRAGYMRWGRKIDAVQFRISHPSLSV